jgi:23S rRNA pseudouridine1911/1915/1917 synthase
MTQEGKNLEEWLKTFTRQALHSYKISFIHPRSKEEMNFEVDLPQDLQELESLLKLLQ